MLQMFQPLLASSSVFFFFFLIRFLFVFDLNLCFLPANDPKLQQIASYIAAAKVLH